MTLLLLDNCVDTDTDGGGGDLLGESIDSKLGSSKLLLLPHISHQFRHGYEKGEMGGLSSEKFYLL